MKRNKINIISCIIIVTFIVIMMMFYINKKEGFGEDEIFSYGSSNYAYDNLYQPYGTMDITNQIIFKYILKNNWLKNIIHYLNNSNEFFELCNKELNTEPIWKTKEEAKAYITMSSDDILNYISVIWNQSRDVHPPLFYILVHIVSTLYMGKFSKYIIFTINIIFFVLSCYEIYKILKLYRKEKLAPIVLILYGMSMGGISTVMFQRMYMMLTFFILAYTQTSLKICRVGLRKKELKQISIITILGFLTQYYFCIFVISIFIIFIIKIKEKRKWIVENIKLAILGICIFPASIYHIFFSYRGIGSMQVEYFSRLRFFIEQTFKGFGITNIIGYIPLFITLIALVILIIKNRKGKRLIECVVLSLPIVIYYLIISKSAPYLEQRYIMPVLPLIALGIILLGEYYISKIKYKKVMYVTTFFSILALQIYGITTTNPSYLYEGYNEYINLANKYKDYQFVYVGSNQYNHIRNMPEFCIYKESLILSEKQIDLLQKREVEEKFIVCIKNYVDINNTLNEILKITNSNEYELLLEGKVQGFEANYYIISKK